MKTNGTTMTLVLGGLVSVALILLAGYGTYVWQQRKIDDQKATIASLQTQLSTVHHQPATNSADTYTSGKGVKITVYAPPQNAVVVNPVAVVGEVPGSWSFEASFPIKLLDSHGTVVASGTAHVLGDWMTSALVPFSASLTFTGNPSGPGNLVLQKDNPSGLSQNDDQVSIPVRF